MTSYGRRKISISYFLLLAFTLTLPYQFIQKHISFLFLLIFINVFFLIKDHERCHPFLATPLTASITRHQEEQKEIFSNRFNPHKCGSNLCGDKMGLDADPTFYRSHRSKAECSSPLWHFCTWLKAMAAQSAYQAFDFTMFKVICYKHCAILWKLVSKYFWIFTRIKKRKSIVDQWVIFEDNCVMLGIRS